jgi:hypothetical protein
MNFEYKIQLQDGFHPVKQISDGIFGKLVAHRPLNV